VLFPHLNERQRRLLMAAEIRGLGHGGVRAVDRAAGVSETTVRKGVFGLEAGQSLLGRVRRPGGGCKRAANLRFQASGPLLAAGGGTSAGARPRLRRPAAGRGHPLRHL
jgi:hypothetical protein